MSKVLVTGHRGFVGTHFCAGVPAVGLTDVADQLVDLNDFEAVCESVARHAPDAVVHLAAQAFVPASFADPAATYQTNFIGTQNLFSALKRTAFRGRILFVSSSDVYGQVPVSALPISEAVPPNPINPYALSKRAAELLCDYWVRIEGMDIVIARPFPHLGPGQSPSFALADFSRSIAEMKAGRRPPLLEVGDLDVTRDYTDVRDVVEAYKLLLEKGARGEVYNVCTGIERHMAESVALLGRLAGMEVEIRIDPARLRKTDHRRSLGSNQKLRQRTGWQPRIPWETSLEDLLAYWESSF